MCLKEYNSFCVRLHQDYSTKKELTRHFHLICFVTIHIIMFLFFITPNHIIQFFKSHQCWKLIFNSWFEYALLTCMLPLRLWFHFLRVLISLPILLLYLLKCQCLYLGIYVFRMPRKTPLLQSNKKLLKKNKSQFLDPPLLPPRKRPRLPP